MTSSMTSHATIGNSTFGEPRSGETTLSSIDGPSDFTENLFDYIKGNKQPAAKKSTRAKPRVKPQPRLHLIRPEESGIIIESHSQFSDGPTEYRISDKPMYSPTKTEDSKVDGPTDFTANIVEYMKGTKPYSPPARASAEGFGNEKMKAFLPSHEKAVLNSGKVTTPSAVAPSTNNGGADAISSPRLNQNLVINGPSDFTASLAEFINGTTPNGKAKIFNSKANTPNSKAKTFNVKAKEDDGDLRSEIARLQAQLMQRDGTIYGLRNDLSVAEKKSSELETELDGKNTTINKLQASLEKSHEVRHDLEYQLHQIKTEVNKLQGNLNVSSMLDASGEKDDADGHPQHLIVNNIQRKDRAINRMHHDNIALKEEIEDLRVQIADKDLLLIDMEEVRKPMKKVRKSDTEKEIEWLKQALLAQYDYCDDLKSKSEEIASMNQDLEATISFLEARHTVMDERVTEMEEKQKKKEKAWQARAKLWMKEIEAQYNISDELTTKNEELEATISSFEKRQAEIEERHRKDKKDWQSTAMFLKKQLERRGAACLDLWGQVEHPGEKDDKGRQKFGYKHAKKSAGRVTCSP